MRSKNIGSKGRAAIGLASLLSAWFILRLTAYGLTPQHGFRVRYYGEPASEARGRTPPLLEEIESPGDHGLLFDDARTSPAGTTSIRYEGTLWIEKTRTIHLSLGTAGRSRLWVDQTPVAGQREDPADDFPLWGAIQLGRGLHDLRIEFQSDRPIEHEGGLFLLWSRNLIIAKTPFDNPLLENLWGTDDPGAEPVSASLIFIPGTSEKRLLFISWLELAATAMGWLTIIFIPALILPHRIFRPLYFRLGAATAGLLAACLLAEILLRAAHYRPREYIPGDIYRRYKFESPGARFRYCGYVPYNIKEFETEVEINSQGWRDREYPLEKRAGVYRILVLGDSYTQANEVPLSLAFHKQLETMLNARFGSPERQFEVVALGMGGFGTVQELNALRKKGMAYHPDLVLLTFFPGNDVMENLQDLKDYCYAWRKQVYIRHVLAARVYFNNRWLKIENSRLNQFIAQTGGDFYVGYLNLFDANLRSKDFIPPEIAVYQRKPYDALWTRAWEVTKKDFLQMRELSASANADFRVMLIYSPQLPGYSTEALVRNRIPEIEMEKPFSLLSEFCDKNGIKCLNLAPPFRDFYLQSHQPFFWKYDAHWNALGHTLAAKKLFDFLASSPPWNAPAYDSGSPAVSPSAPPR